MAAPYIPPTDPLLRVFAVNYQTLTTATPGAFGITAPDAVTISDAVNLFVVALDAYTEDTRTAVLVAAKNAAKNAMIGILRTYSAQIRLNPGVTDENKVALGLNLPNNTPSPIPAPVTNPLISVIGSTPGSHTIRYADSNTPDKRSKPFGAVAMELYRVIGAAPVEVSTNAVYYGLFTKQPAVVQFLPGQAGDWCTYFARWVTRSGPQGIAQPGPFSAAVSFIIPGA